MIDLLDHYAAAALTGLLSDGTLRRAPDYAAELALAYANAMLDARKEAFGGFAAIEDKDK